MRTANFSGGALSEADFILETPQELEKRLGLNFNDILLLTRALTHRSYINENPEAIEDNERLEFLGDAVLDFLVGEWLYEKYPEMPEGDLTQMRSALVQTEELADFARHIHLGDALRLGRGEIKTGGRGRNSLLCDAFEALIGAIYLDQGLTAVRAFLDPLLEIAVKDILEKHKNEDPKSKLQEWSQALGYPPPKYVMLKASGPDHSKMFEVEVCVNKKSFAKGSGKSKQLAEKDAAKKALERIYQD